ncbi:hypothetical protein BDKNPLJD_00231 [Lactobacillus helveticus]|uniref:Uncharacterized protein n=1 Tax=Lactobacillus helveticus TaxID=1587 RepID=A0A2X0RJM4_LACHE|nr:hypothetical protein [Lactobacillus helveticus]MCT3404918.1 hypothetical protein [Lactobacillus helveticus]MCT3419407.1 hypothetical protein [Lactobacillus helveticus]MCT3420451.1 hypothetical protein [Lactobacillus helveticus]SPS13437.1 hypothetical protein BDKNPLJD_00231 [Lactobacillus helveticus]
MKYLSRNQAEQWLNQHTLYGKKRKMFTNKFMKRLSKTCRLVPDKNTLFGKKYSLLELLVRYNNRHRHRHNQIYLDMNRTFQYSLHIIF